MATEFPPSATTSMSRLRALTLLPRLSSNTRQHPQEEDMMDARGSRQQHLPPPSQPPTPPTSSQQLQQPSPSHSRNSSGASITSMPNSPTSSSVRSHNRWPSSSSSLATSPDSPINISKSPLHDLVEDPAERDDGLSESPLTSSDEPLCICDTPFCQHRKTPRLAHSAAQSPTLPEWTPGDDFLTGAGIPSAKRRRSGGEHPADTFASRLSRRLPSISRRWREHRASLSTSHATIRSPPASRSTSLRLSSFRQSSPTSPRSPPIETPPFTPVDVQSQDDATSRPRALSRSHKPADIYVPDTMQPSQEPQELAVTPLLPPMTMEQPEDLDEIQSLLQTPSVAPPSAAASILGTPVLTPVHANMPTPPLSSQPSLASFGHGKSGSALPPYTEIPPMAIFDETDEWSRKLGHANFHILPEPYLPTTSDVQSCKRLLDDWETARMEYMRQAARISEHYGPTSQVFLYTEEKWATIDQQWRSYHERASAEAGVHADDPYLRPLAETQALTKIPSLVDPQQPTKFLSVDEADIVGPMVTYAKLQPPPSRKRTLLKLFTDPASLLGGKAPFGLRR